MFNQISVLKQPTSKASWSSNSSPNELPTDKLSIGNVDFAALQHDSLSARLLTRWKRASLSTKATAFAILVGTLPVLGIGTIAYQLADHGFREKTAATHQKNAVRLTGHLNRFMLERFSDVRMLAKLPTFTTKSRDNTSVEDKKAILDSFVESNSSMYDSVAVVDLAGDVIVQSKGRKLPNQKDQPYFQSVFRGDSPYIERFVSSSLETDSVIYLAAPIRDSATGKTIAIIRTGVSLPTLEEAIRDYQLAGAQYYINDATGKFFIATDKSNVGQFIQTVYDITQVRADPSIKTLHSPETLITTNKFNGTQQLLTYVPPMMREGLPPLDWEVLMTIDTATAFAPQQQFLAVLAMGTLLTAVAVGVLAALLVQRFTRPVLEATRVVTALGQGNLDRRVVVNGEDELGVLGAHINRMAMQLQTLLHQATRTAERSQRLSEITTNLRKSLKYDEIMQTVVVELRDSLKVDRALVYQFDDQWYGTIVSESVGMSWATSLNAKVADPCFGQSYVEKYQRGHVQVINNIDLLDLDTCYRHQLNEFQVKASVVAPILYKEQLMGLLVVHQCSAPRLWEESDRELVQQVAIQLGFALEQARLLEQREQARQAAEALSDDRQQQQEELQNQLMSLIGSIEGASSGDLTVRADVTAGEIGIVADFFNSIVENLRQIVTQVKQAAGQVNTSLGSNEQSMRSLADTSLQQAEETTQTLNAVEEMVRSIQAVAENAQQAALITRSAAVTAEAGGTAMDRTVHNILGLRETIGETAKKVKRLGESSQQISKVVSLINQIAMQTNLLAINAGIEAARAGEDSHGFAIVAEEVADLATRSATATREIEQIVATIQRETSEVVEAMEQGTTQVVEGTRSVESAKQSLANILEVSQEIDQLVQSISDATVSQVQTSETITTLMEKVADIANSTSQSSLEVSQALRQTVDVAQKLQNSVGTFKVSE
jgi:methyl-accepting chemotaxis protein PixJ